MQVPALEYLGGEIHDKGSLAGVVAVRRAARAAPLFAEAFGAIDAASVHIPDA